MRILIVLTLIAASMCNVALAGDSAHGGGAFICPDPTQSEFLDLFEAHLSKKSKGLGLQISLSDDPVEIQIQKAFNRLRVGSPLYNGVLATYAEVRSAKVNPTDSGATINWPEDEKNHLSKTGCAPIGVILYSDENNSILQDLEHLPLIGEQNPSPTALPNTQQAAAWVHETIYKFLRKTQYEKDSIRARKITGHLFSTESEGELNAALIAIAGLNIWATNRMYLGAPDFGPHNLVFSAAYPGEPVRFWVDFQPSPKSDPRCHAPKILRAGFGNPTWSGDWNEKILVPLLTPTPFQSESHFIDAPDFYALPIDKGFYSQSKDRHCDVQPFLTDELGDRFPLSVCGASDQYCRTTVIFDYGKFRSQ